jgi:hypothetical protein
MEVPVDHRKGNVRGNHIDRVGLGTEAMDGFYHRQHGLSSQNLPEQTLTTAIEMLYDYHGRTQPRRQSLEKL